MALHFNVKLPNHKLQSIPKIIFKDFSRVAIIQKCLCTQINSFILNKIKYIYKQNIYLPFEYLKIQKRNKFNIKHFITAVASYMTRKKTFRFKKFTF